MQQKSIIPSVRRRSDGVDSSSDSFNQWKAAKVVDQLLKLKHAPSQSDFNRMELDVHREGLGIELTASDKYFTHTWLSEKDQGDEIDKIRSVTSEFNTLLENDPQARAIIADTLTNHDPDSQATITKCLIFTIVKFKNNEERVLVGVSGHAKSSSDNETIKVHTALIDMSPLQ